MRPGKIRHIREEILTPGRFLQERVLDPDGLTQDKLANALGVSRLTVNQLINERRSITAEMALRLEAATRVSAEMWLNLQRALDLRMARERMAETLRKIKPITTKRHFIEVRADIHEEV
jgi:antitoxin HigA-1